MEQSLVDPLIERNQANISSLTPTRESAVISFGNGLSSSSSERDNEEVASRQTEWPVWEEMKKLLWLGGPMICVTFLQSSLTFVSVMFVGHLGELELASAAIANSFANVTGIIFLIGMAGALETLCGQAFGAKQYHMLGIYMQRVLLVLYITALPLAVVWFNMGTILRVFGQDPEISEKAGEYARWLIPCLFAYASLQPMVKFLQTQSLVLPMALFSLTTLCFHVPICWLLIYKLGVGFRGAALASSLSNWLNVFFLATYVKFSPRCQKTWKSFSGEAFNDLGAFFKLAIPSTVMTCLESWSFESLVLLSGLLPNPKLETSALSICLSTTTLLYMIPFGLGAALSTRVSNELGADHPQAAKRAVRVAVGFGVLEGVLVASLLKAMAHVWGWAFTNEAQVAKYVESTIPFLGAMVVLDAILGVLVGVARGSGWQTFGAWTNLGSYYVVGMPTGIVMAFVLHLNGKGLWIGMLCAMLVQTTTLLVGTFYTNWEIQAKGAVDRVYTSAAATLPIESNYRQ